MSWIKKIFTVFQNDDEINDIEQDQPVSKPLKKEQNEKRDIEAKVLYQYPKGQFRFPLIPDEEAAPEKSKPRKGHPERVIQDVEIKPFIKEQGTLRIKNERQSESDSFHNQRRDPAADARSTVRRDTAREPIEPYKPKKAVEPAPKFHYETRKDSGPKFRQPFKPTEIPSPIYAFNRPPRKSKTQTDLEDVEYELAGFEKVQSSAVEQIKHNDINILSQAMDLKEVADSTKVHEEIVMQDIYIEDDLADTQVFKVAEVDEQVEQSELETEALDIILNSDTELEFVSQNESITDAELEQDAVETEAVVSQNRSEETKALASHHNLPDSQKSQEEYEANGYEQHQEELTVQPVDNAEVQNTKTEKSFEEAEPEHTPDPDPTIEEKPAEPKRQLPFNVLMLKQDKRKWEERNTSKYPSFMTEGRKTSERPPHPEVDAPSSDDSGEKNQMLEDELSAGGTSSEVQHVQQEKPSAAQQEYPSTVQQENLIGAESASGAVTQQDTLSVEISPVTGPSNSEEQTQAQPAAVNSSSAPMNRQFEREEIQTNDREAVVQPEVQPAAVYDFPPLNLLSPPVFKAPDPEWLSEQEHMLNETLRNFNVGARVVNVTQGPSVTRFEVQPEPGVKVNKITNLSDDIKLSLAAKDIRIEAPIPGKHTIGIEVPNHSSRPVLLSEILQSAGFMDLESPLSVALGLDIAGNPIVTDLKKMPHGLIAGATGSGKSVCINTMLVSLLYKAHPDEVKLLLIDPKMVELAPYNRIPHLVSPVITDVKAATASLKWAVEEMERRYELFAHTGVRDIGRFNELAEKHRRFSDKLPYIVIVIDELADLMMMAPGDVEEAICRIAQKARACGIHLIIATQRPSVDVITGLIKANVPTRIAFSVSSQVDSRTIIDISGAEKLLGRGDMLFLENGSSKPFRLQGNFVTDNEIDDIVAFVREQRAPQYLFEQEELLKKAQVTEEEDELFYEACEFVIDQGGASTSSVQRRFKIGYNRAARLIEMMEQQGFISEGKGSKPRDVLITAADLEALQETSTFN
ncbi:DNA translocase FtsK [Mesobacillus sp.]|uniref:DNA translocase FtsK n=1 Tax=Mesobacillus sp. TaxID=2675271 RepID=UPI0039EFFE8B